MSQMNNKKPGNWKSATPVGMQAKQAMNQAKNAIANHNRAENAVINAKPGTHNEMVKNLQKADEQSTHAINHASRMQEQANKQKKLTTGAIGANRAPAPKPTPTNKPGLGNAVGGKPTGIKALGAKISKLTKK
jgi:hypothetical protein